MPQLLESVMLICFGISWPLNLIKSWRSRTAKGQSLWFLLVIFVGYVSGITHKILYSPDIVMALYVLNLLMVTANIAVFFRNKKLDKANA